MHPQSALRIPRRGLGLGKAGRKKKKKRFKLEMGLKPRVLNENLYRHS